MKLTSMTNFVFQQVKQKQSTNEFKESVKKYAELLTQPLALGMFVPCDKEGVVLEEPEPNDLCGSFFKMQTGFHDEVKYSEAKERMLFEGFEIQKDTYHQTKRTFYKIGKYKICLLMEFHTGRKETIYNYKEAGNTIEDLVNYDLTLSDSALK